MILTVIAGLAIGLIIVVVAHEMGHLIAARTLKIPIRRVSLGLGPVVWRFQHSEGCEFVLRLIPVSAAVAVPGRFDPAGNLRRPASNDMLVAAAGPLASLALAAMLASLALILHEPIALQWWLLAIATLSLVAGLLNLIPIPGLDGGHLLLLVLAHLGLRLSPSHELKAHQLGLRLTAASVLAFLVVRFALFS